MGRENRHWSDRTTLTLLGCEQSWDVLALMVAWALWQLGSSIRSSESEASRISVTSSAGCVAGVGRVLSS